MRQFFTLIKSDGLKQLGQRPRNGTKENSKSNLTLISIYIAFTLIQFLTFIFIFLDACMQAIFYFAATLSHRSQLPFLQYKVQRVELRTKRRAALLQAPRYLLFPTLYILASF